MKKLGLVLLLAAVGAFALTACSKEEDIDTNFGVEQIIEGVNDASTVKGTSQEPENPEAEEEESHEGMYRSELTNEWIDESLKNQRPIAVMIDNESTALPHYGINSADVVYEIMNSTKNNRITRLMAICKDWKNITQLGSVRSTRPTNFMLAAEWNAILIHDGGPFYNDQYYPKKYVNNLSGGFARIKNGKATEFTEYVTYDDYTNSDGKTYEGLATHISKAGYSEEYNEYYPGPHFQFSNDELDVSNVPGAQAAKKVSLPFYHNNSKLVYNEETKLYEYYEYGEKHIDAITGETTTFKNVILQGVSHTQLDENGYLIYNVIGHGTNGYYLTNGYAIPMVWAKPDEAELTLFTNGSTGEDLVLNTGKTYIAVVPDDTWDEVELN